MAGPGTLGGLVPDGEDALVRKIADLQRQLRELGPSVAASFATTVASLQEQIAYQASLTTTSMGGANISTGAIAGNRTFVRTQFASITGPTPTGRVLITFGAGEASLQPGDATAIAEITIQATSTTGWSSTIGVYVARAFARQNQWFGTSLMAARPLLVPTGGETTITAYCGVWSSSEVDLASAVFNSPYLTVQVIPAGVV